MLGTNQLWTMEGRWAEVSLEMIRSGDYVHPSIYGSPYYDKPLFSYWLMVAAAWLLGGLTEFAMRLPSALAGIFAIWCMVRLATRLFDEATGLAAGWVLLSTTMFMYWGRIASADMLNLAAVLAAVTWYVERRDAIRARDYAIFWAILGAGCLMKGLVAAAITVVVLAPDLVSEGRWRRHLRPAAFLGVLCGATIYALPFVVSNLSRGGYAQSGLDMAYEENLVRYFKAFDHDNPPWIYLKTTPLYLIPWTPMLAFAAWRLARSWKSLSWPSRWCAWATALVFVFMTASSSRRDYYMLPLLPFAALVTADWLRAAGEGSRRLKVAGWIAAASVGVGLAWVVLVVPWSMSEGGMRRLASDVRAVTGPEERECVLFDAPPDTAFYLAPRASRATRFIAGEGARLSEFVRDHPRVIVVARRRSLAEVAPRMDGRAVVQERWRTPEMWRNPRHENELLVVWVGK